MLQPDVNTSQVVDEWKLFQVDDDLPTYNKADRIENFWRKVSEIQSSDGGMKYKLLPTVIKSVLVLGKTNADSERSLSVNARIVTEGRTLLNERTIIGLHVVKDGVKFFDPVSNRPEKIIITKDKCTSVKICPCSIQGKIRERKRGERRTNERS